MKKIELIHDPKLGEELIKLLKKRIERLEKANTHLKAQLFMDDVSDCQFERYAEFCIECDRKGMKPLKYKDYLEVG